MPASNSVALSPGVGERDEEAVGPGTVVSDIFAEERFYG